MNAPTLRPLELEKHTVELTYAGVNTEPVKSPDGVQYLTEHGVVLLGQTTTYLGGLRKFLKGYGPEADFEQYLDDPMFQSDHAALLSKFAGQLCYMSLGPKRTKNERTEDYFENIKKEGHGSVIEHPVYTVLFYGVNRAFTHEAVRHRVGKAFSQQSQRYVGPDMVRYVMPRALQKTPRGVNLFHRQIVVNRQAYIDRIEYLLDVEPDIDGESRTDKRKRVQSFARTALANEVEAPIVMSGNVRSWRHFLTMRCAPKADEGIRIPSYDLFRILRKVSPVGFNDFAEEQLKDGTMGIVPSYRKV